MRNAHVNAYMTEHGFLKAIETALEAPETLDMSEAEVATKMRIMALILAMRRDATDDLLSLIDRIQSGSPR